MSPEKTAFDLAAFVTRYKDLATFITASVAVLGFLHGFYNSRKLRKNELRWKQANISRETVDSLHKHDKARPALDILDRVDIKKAGYEETASHDEIVLDKGKDVKISYKTILDTLPKSLREANEHEMEKVIIDHFDWFFYYIDRMEQNITSQLFCFDDVKYIFLPYFIKITQNKKTTKIYTEFMKDRAYYLALSFWKRFLDDKKIKKLVTKNEPRYNFPDASYFDAAIPTNFFTGN